MYQMKYAVMIKIGIVGVTTHIKIPIKTSSFGKENFALKYGQIINIFKQTAIIYNKNIMFYLSFENFSNAIENLGFAIPVP